jgi:branched-chain amino acid transport system ATP-binding protein
MLRLENISVKYGNAILALEDVSIKVEEKSIVGLFGSNGAGKTTVLRAISGLLRSEEGAITKGSIKYKNAELQKKRAEDIVRMGIIQVIEGRRIFGNLTVYENLMAGAHTRKNIDSVKKDIDLVVGEYFPRLKELSHQISGYLSGGEQQMLVIARALMAKPSLMLLDEPSMGLAPMIVSSILKIISQIRNKEEKSILLVEQNVKAGLSICDYGYVLENGRIALEGSRGELSNIEELRKHYL